jgi:predicted amidohydrolase YtcJ
VGLPSSIMIIATAVNRTSRTNKIIGENERITPYIALSSITKWAAYQNFTENLKGTLKVGKLADLVVLDKNPLKVEPKQLFDIQVIETIKEGKSIYKK